MATRKKTTLKNPPCPFSFLLHILLRVNLYRFFNELSNNTTTRFNSVVIMAYTISAFLFIIVSATGFLTFGSISDGLILNNYATNDSLMIWSRAAVALSLVFTYPLPFVGLRDGVLALAREFVWVQNNTDKNIDDTNAAELSSSLSISLEAPTTSSSAAATTVKDNKEDNDNDSFAVTTILSLVLLGAVTLGAESISDLKLVLAVGGGTFSTAVASVFPALMFRSAMLQKHKLQDDNDINNMNNSNNNNNNSNENVTILAAADDIRRRTRQWESFEIKFVTALMGLSIAIGATGVYRALESAMQQ
jgi:amino acid permease